MTPKIAPKISLRMSSNTNNESNLKSGYYYYTIDLK